MPSKKRPKAKPGLEWIPLKDIRMEDGAEELVQSADAQPYIRAISALLQKKQADLSYDALRELPLEKRYVWRVISALKWAFVDCDGDRAALDRRTMSREDMKQVVESLNTRPLQFCLFLKALVGEKAMETVMLQAIRQAKRLG